MDQQVQRPGGGPSRSSPGLSKRPALCGGGAGPRVELGCQVGITVLLLAQSYGGGLWAHLLQEGVARVSPLILCACLGR